MAGYRDRYFTEALPALAARKQRPKAQLSRLLFPATLVSEATIEAANAAEPPDNVLRLAVAEQATIMRRRLAASQQPAALADSAASPLLAGIAGRFAQQVAQVARYRLHVAWPSPRRHVAVRPDQDDVIVRSRRSRAVPLQEYPGIITGADAGERGDGQNGHMSRGEDHFNND